MLLLCAMGLWIFRQSAPSAGMWWLFGWAMAVLSSAAYVARDALPSMGLLSPVPASLSPSLLLAGVLALTHREVPRWLLPTAFALGVVRSATVAHDFWPGMQGLGFVTGPPVMLVATWIAWRSEPQGRRSFARRLLAPSLFVVMLLGAASEAWVLHAGGFTTLLSGLWIVVAPPALALQLLAAVEEGRDVLRRRNEELDRRVAERTKELAQLNRSLAHEVDERRSIELALRESEERYRHVSELSSDFSFALRVDAKRGMRREWVTEAFERITGYPPEALDGHGWLEVLHDEERERTRADVLDARGRGISAERLHRVVRPDGEIRWLAVQIHSLPLAEDGCVRVVGAARDVTAAREAEHARLELERQVEQAQRIEGLGMLAGGIAHDFNNLLAVILGNTRLVESELPDASWLRDRLARVRTAAEHAAGLTEQMLAYSGKANVRLEPIPLTQVVKGLEDLLRDSVAERCTLSFELACDALIEADLTRLRRVLINLVTNASEALGEAGGHVRVRTGVSQLSADDLSGPLSAPGSKPGEYGWLEVSDDGAGMDEQTCKRIFEPFFTTKFSGRGLGLASVLGVVRAHRGVVEVESEPERGTRVRILIPLSRRVPLSAPLPRPGSRELGRILVVDDDEAVLDLAAECISRAGGDVVSALGGREALEHFGKEPHAFDVVVLDLAMPDLDGREVERALRALRPEVPIVLTTGNAQEERVEDLLERPHVAILNKPFTPAGLIDAIQLARGDRAAAPSSGDLG